MAVVIPSLRQTQAELFESPEILLSRLLAGEKIPLELVFLEECHDLLNKLVALSLDNMKMWSAFDAIQMVEMANGTPLVWDDLDLLHQYDPVFRQGSILLFKGNKKVAEIFLHQNIEVFEIHYFSDNEQVIIDRYDSRGFLSTRLWTNSQKKVLRKQWFTPKFEKVMEASQEGEIKITKSFLKYFNQEEYSSIEDIIFEKYREHIPSTETVILTAGKYGWDIKNMQEYLHPKRIVAILDCRLSREEISKENLNLQDVFWVFPDQVYYPSAPMKASFLSKHTAIIKPYHASLSLGVSNEMEEKNVYWYTGDVPIMDLGPYMEEVLKILLIDESNFLEIETEQKKREILEEFIKDWVYKKYEIDISGDIYEKVMDIKKTRYFTTEEEWMNYIDENENMETDETRLITETQVKNILEVEQLMERISFVDNRNESLEKHLQEARLYLDTGIVPNLKRQMLAISVGIPQIVKGKSSLVYEGENALQLDEIGNLEWQVDFFLEHLVNWNAALIKNVQLIEKYSPSNLIQQWEEVITNG